MEKLDFYEQQRKEMQEEGFSNIVKLNPDSHFHCAYRECGEIGTIAHTKNGERYYCTEHYQK